MNDVLIAYQVWFALTLNHLKDHEKFTQPSFTLVYICLSKRPVCLRGKDYIASLRYSATFSKAQQVKTLAIFFIKSIWSIAIAIGILVAIPVPVPVQTIQYDTHRQEGMCWQKVIFEMSLSLSLLKVNHWISSFKQFDWFPYSLYI